MSSRLIREAGEALYGPGWHSALARELIVSQDQVQRWEAGAEDVPASVFDTILSLAAAKVRRLYEIAPRLKDASVTTCCR